MSKRRAEVEEAWPETKCAKENPANTGMIRLYNLDPMAMWQGRIDAQCASVQAVDGYTVTHELTGATCTVRHIDIMNTGSYELVVEPRTAPIAIMSRVELGAMSPLQARTTSGCYRFVGSELERGKHTIFLVMVRPFEASAVPRICGELRAGNIALCSSLAPDVHFELPRVDLERYSEALHVRAQHAMPPDTPDAIVLSDFSESNLRLLRDYIKSGRLDTLDVTFPSIDDVFQLTDLLAQIGDLIAVRYLDLALSFHIYALRGTDYAQSMSKADVFKFTALHRLPHSHAAMCLQYGKELGSLVNEFTDEMRLHLVQTLLDLNNREDSTHFIRRIQLS